jgi:hypothetical protein
MPLVPQISSGLVRLTTAIKEIRTIITGSATGDLSALTTTAKTSVVAAINEIDAGGGSGGVSDLDGLTDVTLTSPAQHDFLRRNGSGQFVNTPATASETVPGVVEIATQAEANAGTDAVRVITPVTLAALLTSFSNAVKSEILGAGVPEALNTLDELAAALGDDNNFASTVTTSLAGKQPLDTDLTAIAALTSAADKLPYATGAGTWTLADFTAFARTLLDDANATAARGTLSVYSQAEIGDVTTDFVAVVEAGLA